jgi:hypothetical protein
VALKLEHPLPQPPDIRQRLPPITL